MPTSEPLATSPCLRRPTIEDASEMWQLVIDSGTLDRNSPYLYLLLCRDFAETCLLAESVGTVVGFVSAYRLPKDPSVLFVWQVGVRASARRQGLGLSMLQRLIADADNSIRFVEATVSPSNTPSRRLFESLARELGASMVDEDGFTETLFPSGGHEAEPLIRIGPIESAQLANGAA